MVASIQKEVELLVGLLWFSCVAEPRFYYNGVNNGFLVLQNQDDHYYIAI